MVNAPPSTPSARRLSSTETIPLRHAVLRPDGASIDCVFPGDDDDPTFHAGVDLDGRIVSIASIYRESRPLDAAGAAPCGGDHAAGTAWRLRGMATEPGLQRTGAGTIALQACIAHAREHRGTLAWCNARIEAVGFYEKLGWTVLGTQFDIPTIGPHLVMELRLG
jgi:GNAT superfamily N-acetyltransferase